MLYMSVSLSLRFHRLILPALQGVGDQACSQDCMEGGSTGGPGFPPAGVKGAGPPRGCGAEPPAPKNFDTFTENRPFRDLRVHDIGKSSQVECLCKTE